MKRNTESTAQTPEALLKDLHALVAEAEKLVAGTTAESSSVIESLGDRFSAAQQRFGEFYSGARKKIVAGAKSTDEAIRSNPYQSLAVALGVGVLVGVLVGRRR